MRLSSNEVESRNHCTQLTVKPPPLTLSSGSVPDLHMQDLLNKLNIEKLKTVGFKECERERNTE